MLTRRTIVGQAATLLLITGGVTVACAPRARLFPTPDPARAVFTFTFQSVPVREVSHRRIEVRTASGAIEVFGSVATSCGTEHIGARYTSTSGGTGRTSGDSVLSTLFVNVATFTSSEICLNVDADFSYHAISRVGTPGLYQVRIVHQYLRNEPRIMMDTVVRIQ